MVATNLAQDMIKCIVAAACLFMGGMLTGVEGQLISHSMLNFIDKNTLHMYNLSDPDEYVWREPLAKTGRGGGYHDDVLPYTDVVHEDKHTKTTQSYRIYTVVYATNISNRGFCTMAASGGGHGFQLNVLGEDRQAQFDKTGCNERLWTVRKFVRRIMGLCSSDTDYDESDEGAEGEEGWKGEEGDEGGEQASAKKSPHVQQQQQRLHHSCDKTIILYVDAYDVIFMGSPQKLVDKFLATQKNVLFGSEKGCCGTREGLSWRNTDCDLDWPMPTVATSTPFLNAGVFVGFVQQVAVLLQECWAEQQEYTNSIKKTFGQMQSMQEGAEEGPWNPYVVGGDQALICHVFAHRSATDMQELTGRKYGALVSECIGMSLDYTSSIFLNAYDMQIGRELHITKRGRVKYTAYSRYNVPKRVQAITPLFLHFNGAGKEKDKMFVVAAKIAWPHTNRSTAVSHTMLYSLAHSKYVPLDATCSWRL